MIPDEIKDEISAIKNQLKESYNEITKFNIELILNNLIQIGTYFNHNEIVKWARYELSGYTGDYPIPEYREIICSIIKKQRFKREKRYLDKELFDKPIGIVCNNIKKRKSQYRRTKENSIEEIEFNDFEFKKIIEGVKTYINQYISIIEKKIHIRKDKNNLSKVDFIKELVNKMSISNYLENNKEKNIFIKNLKSLSSFEATSDYKYCMIAMGSILEFLLIRYCKINNISPEPFNKKKGNSFANYIESAIKNEIFGERKRWELIQNHLRDFRNYVHIQKEIIDTEIDENWYKTMKPAFDSLFEQFSNHYI